MTWQTIGFESQKKYFENLIKIGRLGHAYLFTGPSGVGKQMFAKNLVQHLGSEFDYRLISPNLAQDETTISVETMREAKNFLSLSPLYGQYKCLIINDAENLTTGAANAFLKILEEPSAHTLLILISSQPGKLLPTITSRCQEVKFHLNHEAVQSVLSRVRLPKADIDLIETMADGRPGWAVWAGQKGNLDRIKKEIKDLETVLDKGVIEKLQYVKKIHEKENYPDLVSTWLCWAYGQKKYSILGGLLKLHEIVTQPQYNHRLALESFLLNL